MLVCIPSNSLGYPVAATNGTEKGSPALYRSLATHKSALNEIDRKLPKEEKKFRHKRSRILNATLTTSWSDNFIVETIVDTFGIEELLKLLGRLLQPNVIYAPENSERFDNWGG